MDKSKLLTISEFAALSGIKRANLIYYDEIEVLKPVYRGKNNYRLYSYMQLDLAYVILSLRNMGISLDEIKEYAQGRSPNKALELFSKHIQTVDHEIEKLQWIKEIMSQYIAKISTCKDIASPKIELVQLEKETICLGPAIDEVDAKLESMLDFVMLCHGNGIDLVNHTGKLFTQQSMQNKKWSTPDRFYIRTSNGNYQTEKGLYLVLYDRSDDLNKDVLYEKLLNYIKENNLEICGNTYEEYPLDEISINNPNDYLIKIFTKVRQVNTLTVLSPVS